MNSILDNPIWSALTSTDKNKNIGTNGIAWFDSDIAPFIGMPSWNEKNQRVLLQHAPPDRRWYLLIKDEVKFIEEFEISFTIPLYQCICSKTEITPFTKHDTEFVPLDSSHVDEMIALTALTKPGPFKKRTIEFGNYHGIFEDGKLVAMGGERLHINKFTEISAICTHPDYQGRGYGAKIVRYLSSLVVQKDETPFLHARIDNTKALDLYKKEGFEIRCKIEFYIFKNKT